MDPDRPIHASRYDDSFALRARSSKDKVHVWLTKYHYTSNIILGAILFAIGGLPFLFWGIFVRVVVGLHATWTVNSITHMWGSRRFATKDLSTNNFLIALLTFGEGWHNNHHAHPVSARHGLTWYEIDLNWYGIWALKKLGLARHIYKVRLNNLPPKPALTRDPNASPIGRRLRQRLRSSWQVALAAAHLPATCNLPPDTHLSRLQSPCAYHQPGRRRSTLSSRWACACSGGHRAERRLDHPQLAPGDQTFGCDSLSRSLPGLVLNTIFLVREIRRNEQHDSFINAVTHELKTPIASIRLYLQTLQRRRSGRRTAASSISPCCSTPSACCTPLSRF
jgi:hypothetical protein